MLLKKIFQLLKASDIITLIIPIIAIAVATSTLPTFKKLLFTESPKQSTQEKYFEYLRNGINDDLFNANFVKTSFNSFDRQLDGAMSKYGYIETLEDFIVFLNTNRENPNKADKSINQTQVVVDLLAKARETEPYASLPSEERRLMDHIQTLIKTQDNSADINQAMNELKQVILARHKEYQKIEAQNSWSIPLAFAGVFFTIVFGAWSIILSVRKKRNEIERILFSPNIEVNTKTNAEQPLAR